MHKGKHTWICFLSSSQHQAAVVIGKIYSVSTSHEKGQELEQGPFGWGHSPKTEDLQSGSSSRIQVDTTARSTSHVILFTMLEALHGEL